MVEPSGHCPYLGLKQNQAIRFASPTSEHRCYATGQAQEIPVIQPDYQLRYCLSAGHIRCPLYTGSGLPSTPSAVMGPAAVDLAVPSGGLRGWFIGLSPRDRAIYLGLLTLLVFIVGIYMVAGVNLLRDAGAGGTAAPPGSSVAATSTDPARGPPTSAPALADTATLTLPPPSDTPLPPPSDTPLPPPSDTPLPPPSDTPLPPPSDTPLPPPSDTPLPPTLTNTAAPLTPIEPPADTPTPEPLADTPTPEPPADTPTPEPPADTPTPEPPIFGSPTQAPEPARTPDPQPPPEGLQTQQRLTLYFTDATDTLFVSVARLSVVVDAQVARAAINELIAGPQQAGMQRLIPPDVRLLDVRREGSRLIANFDRRPAWGGDDRGLYAITLSLTELAGVREVQIQVSGANIGVVGGRAPIPRSAINPDNPLGLSERFDSGTRFLPLYFLSGSGRWVRVTRLSPRTDDVARATLDALLDGPGSYGGRLYSAIPLGTRASGGGLRGDGDRVVVDLTRPFLDAFSRQAAVDAIVYSLTELRDPSGARLYSHVEILVDGRKLSDDWGPEFDRQFTRKALNPE